MKKLMIFTALTACLGAGTPAAGAETISNGPNVSTERWEGKILTAKFRAGMCFEKNGKAKGVFILRHANGKEDIYHLNGTLKDNHFELSHSSGHHFSGKLESHNRLTGTAKIKNGPNLKLTGTRKLNVPLAAEDCAPLD